MPPTSKIPTHAPANKNETVCLHRLIIIRPTVTIYTIFRIPRFYLMHDIIAVCFHVIALMFQVWIRKVKSLHL